MRTVLVHAVDTTTNEINGSESIVDPAGAVIVQDFDTKVPIGELKELLSKRLKDCDLSKHDLYLHDFQLNPTSSLFDHGLKVPGTVELSIQVQTNNECSMLNIIEIAKVSNEASSNDVNQDEGSPAKRQRRSSDGTTSEKIDEKQDDLGIPGNPIFWTPSQVHKWMIWVVKEFGYDTSVIQEYDVEGAQLCNMTQNQCVKRFPYGDLLYSHLDLLKKLNQRSQSDPEATPASSCLTSEASSGTSITTSSLAGSQDGATPSTFKKMWPLFDRSSAANRTASNGQIQLWQFLLEMLTDADCIDYISWVGTSGEFKLINPHRVARMWGERKNKPAMNYEKLSRALRYYYDSEIISKVPGKRFVYKFVCNLKELVGFDAAQLDKQVRECLRRRKAAQNRNVDEYLHTPQDSDVTLVLGATT